MNVRQLAKFLDLRVAAGDNDLDREVTGGYCGDLLSDVMANAPLGCVWMTVQSHPNIVAVSVLREMAAVILTGGRAPDPDTVSKADQERIPILLWPGSAFELAGRLYTAGLGARPPE